MITCLHHLLMRKFCFSSSISFRYGCVFHLHFPSRPYLVCFSFVFSAIKAHHRPPSHHPFYPTSISFCASFSSRRPFGSASCSHRHPTPLSISLTSFSSTLIWTFSSCPGSTPLPGRAAGHFAGLLHCLRLRPSLTNLSFCWPCSSSSLVIAPDSAN